MGKILKPELTHSDCVNVKQGAYTEKSTLNVSYRKSIASYNPTGQFYMSPRDVVCQRIFVFSFLLMIMMHHDSIIVQSHTAWGCKKCQL